MHVCSHLLLSCVCCQGKWHWSDSNVGQISKDDTQSRRVARYLMWISLTSRSPLLLPLTASGTLSIPTPRLFLAPLLLLLLVQSVELRGRQPKGRQYRIQLAL